MRPGDLSFNVIDIAITLVLLMGLAAATGLLANRYPKDMRQLIWLAFVEYIVCATWQYMNGADANGYREIGTVLVRGLNSNFKWAAPEMLKMLVHQPSVFDDLAIGAGSNTGSMCAAAAWLLFLCGGSPYAVQGLVAGLAMFGTLAIYNALHDAAPDIAPKRLFGATVLYPSIAFWTAALHKEAFCIMGMGLLLAGWRAAYNKKIRALFYAPLGVVLILMFRAPALPPLIIGLALHFVMERMKKAGRGSIAVSPVYFGLGLGLLAVGMILTSKVSPELGLDRIADTLAIQQKAWNTLANNGTPGGSAFDLDDAAPVHSTQEQLARAPLALLNALFRPQLFDVTNPLVLVSAIEMSAMTWFMYSAFKRHKVGGVVSRIQQSPFLLMCTVITIVGCTFVGLTTFNFGSMARYRVPFLPFYGSMLAGLLERGTAAESAPKQATTKKKVARRKLVIPARIYE
jgi:hypothetical protein